MRMRWAVCGDWGQFYTKEMWWASALPEDTSRAVRSSHLIPDAEMLLIVEVGSLHMLRSVIPRQNHVGANADR